MTEKDKKIHILCDEKKDLHMDKTYQKSIEIFEQVLEQEKKDKFLMNKVVIKKNQK